MRLAGKRAIVTGAASGIGHAAATLFVREGARVLAADLTLGAPARSDPARDDGLVTARCDVADEAQVAALVDDAVHRFGGLDIMFANAGIIGTMASLDGATVDDWQRVLAVNVIGTAMCVKHAVRVMRDRGGGAIVCTASVAGLRAGAGPAPYSASKAAVLNLVQVAASQLAGTGIRVNAICPGLIETAMTRSIFDEARAAGKSAKIGQLNPSRRAGDPTEVAEVALFLTCDEARYVNGTALVVDGGLAASLPFVPGRSW